VSPRIEYDSIAAKYAQHRRAHPEVLKSLCKSVQCTSKVLEVGCGTGNYIMAIESLIGCMCWGIDPSAEMLSRARERSQAIHFHAGQAERLDFPPAFFDLVFSVDVIHHISDRATYFQEAYRVLKPSGQLCTATDSKWIIRHRQPLALYFPETVESELERYPRIAELQRTMEQVGFNGIARRTVECTYALTDIQAYHDKAYSILHLIPASAFQRGLQRMERDLRAGPIRGVSRYTLLWGTRAAGIETRRGL